MTTTVHLPPDLLGRVDRRARELGLSRNGYIRKALEKAVQSETVWSRRFLQMLSETASDAGGRKAVHEMMREIASRRSRKGPPRL